MKEEQLWLGDHYFSDYRTYVTDYGQDYRQKVKSPDDKHFVRFTAKLSDTYGWGLEKFESTVSAFCKHTGLTRQEVFFDLGYKHSYYDSVDLYLEIYGFRLETDEEHLDRLEELEKKMIAAAKAAEKAKKTKEENERKEYERLQKKYGSKNP